MREIAASEKEQASDLTACHESLRERKKRESREAMHLAALELVVEHGLENVTVDHIADRAGVSPRTLFNYWGSKEAVVLGVDTDKAARVVDMLRARPVHEPVRESMRALIEAHVRQAAPRSESRKLKRQVMTREPQLIQIVANRHKEVSTQLIDVLTERLTPTLGKTAARDVATIHVAWGLAAVRSVYAIAVNRNVDLAEALAVFYDLCESESLGL